MTQGLPTPTVGLRACGISITELADAVHITAMSAPYMTVFGHQSVYQALVDYEHLDKFKR